MQNVAPTETPSLYRKIRSKLGYIDTRAGRQVFGDDNPLTRHIRSMISHNAIKLQAGYKSSSGPRLFDPAELHKKGYISFENLYPPELVKTISRKAGEALGNPEAVKQRDGAYSVILKQSFLHIPEIEQLMLPTIQNALSDYYQAHMNIATVVAWRNYAPDANAPYGVFSSSWHCDRRVPTMIKMFYLVNDTTDQDGPLHIMDRENSRRIVRTEYTERLKMAKIDEYHEQYTKFTGKAGKLLIGNTTYCLHRAGIPAPGRFRDAIQFIIFPSAKPLAKDWIKDFERCRTDLGEQGL